MHLIHLVGVVCYRHRVEDGIILCWIRGASRKLSIHAKHYGVNILYGRGTIFDKSYDQLTKNLGWACDYQKILQKSYEKLRTKLCKTYEKLTATLQVSCENVKFTASDVIRETLCQRLLLFEYFELKIPDNQCDDFLRKLMKNDLPFSWENLTKSYLADLQKT